MKKYYFLVSLLFIICLLSEITYGQLVSSSTKIHHPSSKSTATNFSIKPFTPSFVENKGQFNQYDAKMHTPDFVSPSFGAQMGNTILLFNRNSIQFVENKINRNEKEREGNNKTNPADHEFETLRQTLSFLNSNPDAEFIADKSEKQSFNYPDAASSQRSITANGWKTLMIKNIYVGIDVQYSFKEEGGIKYSFIIHPGADASVINIQWSGVKGMSIDATGNLVMSSENGTFTDKAPKTFYQNDENTIISSSFKLNDKTVSFHVGNYDHSKTLVIDPWVQNPNFITYNSAYDIQHDPAGNIYVYGGAAPYQLQKYTSLGAPIWTYNTGASWYGDFTLDGGGNAYIVYGAWNTSCFKINPAGSLVWNTTMVTNYSIETYRIYPNASSGQLGIIGMFDSAGLIPMIINVNPNTGAFSPFCILSSCNECEARGLTIDGNGNAFVLVFAANGSLNYGTSNVLWKVDDNALTTLGSAIDGYLLTESEPSNTDSDYSGYNGATVNACGVFTYDGLVVKKWDKNTLALLASVNIPGGIAYVTGGLCSDSCGNIYVGGPNSVLEFDDNLNPITTAATTGQVYDVNIGNAPGEILACGQGFFGSYSFPICSNTTNDTSQTINIASCTTPVTLIATATGVSYLWSTGATTDSISVSTSGTYWVQITGATTCAQTLNVSDTFNFTVTPPPIVALGNDTTLCQGQTLTLNAGNAGATYLWSTGANTQTINVTTTGNYWVAVNAGACADTDSIMVTFVAPPVVNLGNDTTLCAGQPITLNAGNAGAFYLWSNGAMTQTISPTVSGNYWVVVSIGTCTDADTININFNQLPLVNLGPDQSICNNVSVTLNAGNPGDTYLWSTGANTQTISVSSAGTYWVQVQNGTCTGSDTVVVNANVGPVVDLGPDITLCNGMDTALNAGNAGMNYQWSNGETTQRITISTSGTYWVQVNNNGCVGSDTANVKIAPPLTISLPPDTVICPGDQMSIDAGTGYASYSWIPGGQSSHLIIINQPGTYGLTVTDTNGCIARTSIWIDDFCPSDLYIPSAFAPDGNNLNGLFMAYGENIIAFHMYVFNRWGQQIYDSEDISKGWDGTFNGNPVPQDTYVYRVDYQLYDYKQLHKHSKVGTVTLIR